MTGQGQGRIQCGTEEVSAEVRAVNNRHLKIQARVSETLAGIEPQLEALVRSEVCRGSMQLNVQLLGGSGGNTYRLQSAVVESYWSQCQEIAQRLGVQSDVGLGQLLSLPGSVEESRVSAKTSEIAPDLVQATLAAVAEALKSLNNMRRSEGASMEAELTRQLKRLTQLTQAVQERAPAVVEEYQKRLESRLAAALEKHDHEIRESDLTREIVLMADKADVREEIVRLESHFQQFADLLQSEQSQGRKLDFLIQEMFREANTIGSKANDAQIAQRVVDIKTTIEQMRELVQNVE